MQRRRSLVPRLQPRLLRAMIWLHIGQGSIARRRACSISRSGGTGETTVIAREPSQPPVIVCRDRLQISEALARLREYRGMTQMDLDAHAGFCEGYTSKLERPFAPALEADRRRTGRCAMHAMLDVWLTALGARVVVLPAEEAALFTLDQMAAPKTRRRAA